MGPIGCTAELAPFLPRTTVDVGEASATAAAPSPNQVSAAPYGSPSILPITHAYIQMMGANGLTEATRRAILNANYMAKRLSEHFSILYTGPDGTVAHEFILDCRPFDKSCGVTVDDIAKRLMDYGFHGPTMSWPVTGTLMVEPTESETRGELDRFCDAMIAIRAEIRKVESGEWPRDNNPLHHAPHPAEVLTDAAWDRPYARLEATHPAASQREPGAKFWPTVARIDNPHGDRNLHCTCAPMASYAGPS
jgi:glycine dehydrogenase